MRSSLASLTKPGPYLTAILAVTIAIYAAAYSVYSASTSDIQEKEVAIRNAIIAERSLQLEIRLSELEAKMRNLENLTSQTLASREDFESTFQIQSSLLREVLADIQEYVQDAETLPGEQQE